MKHDGGDIQSSSGCSSDVQLPYDVNRNNKLCLLLEKTSMVTACVNFSCCQRKLDRCRDLKVKFSS